VWGLYFGYEREKFKVKKWSLEKRKESKGRREEH